MMAKTTLGILPGVIAGFGSVSANAGIPTSLGLETAASGDLQVRISAVRGHFHADDKVEVGSARGKLLSWYNFNNGFDNFNNGYGR